MRVLQESDLRWVSGGHYDTWLGAEDDCGYDDYGNWVGYENPSDSWWEDVLESVGDFIGLDGEFGYNGEDGREWVWSTWADDIGNFVDDIQEFVGEFFDFVGDIVDYVWDAFTDFVDNAWGLVADGNMHELAANPPGTVIDPSGTPYTTTQPTTSPDLRPDVMSKMSAADAQSNFGASDPHDKKESGFLGIQNAAGEMRYIYGIPLMGEQGYYNRLYIEKPVLAPGERIVIDYHTHPHADLVLSNGDKFGHGPSSGDLNSINNFQAMNAANGFPDTEIVGVVGMANGERYYYGPGAF